MLRRELAIVFGARLTWLCAAVSALLVGHSFVLAVDLFSAGARSVESGGLMAREFDPLLGIVRPTLGGLYIATALLGPLVASRALGIESERRSLRVLLLQTAAPGRLLLAKYLASLSGVGLFLLALLASLSLWRMVGGHLAVAETGVALAMHAMHLLCIVALACAAAAWTETVAQATALTLCAVLGSWAIDAAEGFAALAWLGPAAEWSLTRHLSAAEHGVLQLADGAWFFAATLGALSLAYIGLRFDWSALRRIGLSLAALAASVAVMRLTAQIPYAFDCTELERASLPPAAVQALRSLRLSLSMTVHLDQDDARRRQLESDVISKLRLARPDLHIRFPLDERQAPAAGDRDGGYGRIEVCAGSRCKETYSGSRQELLTLLFEAAGKPLPEWTQLPYPGYPLIIEGSQRAAILWTSYILFPGALVVAGVWGTRRRKRK